GESLTFLEVFGKFDTAGFTPSSGQYLAFQRQRIAEVNSPQLLRFSDANARRDGNAVLREDALGFVFVKVQLSDSSFGWVAIPYLFSTHRSFPRHAQAKLNSERLQIASAA